MRRNYSVHSTHRSTVGRFGLSDEDIGICVVGAAIKALVIVSCRRFSEQVGWNDMAETA
jgi:hypothetical protein